MLCYAFQIKRALLDCAKNFGQQGGLRQQETEVWETKDKEKGLAKQESALAMPKKTQHHVAHYQKSKNWKDSRIDGELTEKRKIVSEEPFPKA